MARLCVVAMLIGCSRSPSTTTDGPPFSLPSDTFAGGAAGATLIDTQGIIAPGTIDTHNHILFDIFDNSDWFPAQLYQDHDQWTTEPKYGAMLDVKQCLVDDSQGKPDWCAMTAY